MSTSALNPADFDTYLEFILEDEGRKQIWLAQRTGIDKSRLNNIVHGLKPSDDEAALIAAVLRREIADVFADRGLAA